MFHIHICTRFCHGIVYYKTVHEQNQLNVVTVWGITYEHMENCYLDVIIRAMENLKFYYDCFLSAQNVLGLFYNSLLSFIHVETCLHH